MEQVYDEQGDLLMVTTVLGAGGLDIAPYRNNRIHGQRIRLDSNRNIKHLRQYRNGQQHGLDLKFDKMGRITEKVQYTNGRANSPKQGQQKGYYVNGLLNGKIVYYHKNGQKRLEGQYWNGYHAGKWTTYHKDGSYTEEYYPAELNGLMKACREWPLSTKNYNKEGVLMSCW